MALTLAELDAVTKRYIMADKKKAVDIFFNTSFFMTHFMKKQKGIWERPTGGLSIGIPLNYDGAEGGFFTKSSTLSSDERETLNTAIFGWKNSYGNATIHQVDEIKNSGPYADVSLAVQRVENAQQSCSRHIAQNIFNAAGDGSELLTGVRALFGTTTSVKYGDIAEADLVAQDGTTPWKANVTTTTESISLPVIRTLASLAKITDGPQGKPDIGFMSETLFNIVAGLLMAHQRFTEEKDTVKAGFQNLVFEGKMLLADDFATSGWLFLFNSKYIGFAVHADHYFSKSPWMSMLPNGKPAKTMKFFWHGNLVCSNRKSHAAHSNLS